MTVKAHMEEKAVEQAPEQPAAPRVPTPNRIVTYRLTAHQAAAIKTRREHARNLHPDIYQGGNPVHEGDEFPLLIVRVWGQAPDSRINGQVFFDGADTLWALSVRCGEGPGTWSWPERG